MRRRREQLLGTTLLVAIAAPLATLGLALGPSAAVAQAQTGSATAATTNTTAVGEVVVTGSILHHRNVDSISPLTVETAKDLEVRGITTLDQAIQNLAGNNSGALPNSFSANGAFATGASGASLRGLTTNSTLVLFDGLRAAYYPLADDGTRNFVDLNTIPDVIVDRVEVLQDGASSTYGADAIAGVINIITKKQYQGLTVTGEGGFGQRPGGDETHVSALAGYGDLARQGYNMYVGVEYQHDSAILNSQRGFPYNTADLSSICGASLLGGQTCETNAVRNGLQYNGVFQGIGSTTVATVIDPAASSSTPAGIWQLLNPSAGCGRLNSITLTPAETSDPTLNHSTLCQLDLIHDYGVIAPEDTRFSISGRLTKSVGANAQAYIEVNYYQNDVFFINAPSNIRQQATPGSAGTSYDTSEITLPVYVCPSGVNCSAANGTLNPNDPFAAMGDPASIRYLFGDIPNTTESFSQVYRIATGIDGSFATDWKYSVGGVFMESDLDLMQKGNLYIANLLNAVATGAYNFVDPSQNSDAIRNFIAPENVQNSFSQVAQLEGNLSRDVLNLPGGPLQVGIGAAVRYERVYNPSDNDDANSAIDRWFTINPFGAIGDRTVESAYFEIDAPPIRRLDLNISGRYDNYSSGQSNFSPKFGIKYRPIDLITLRATYSEGFRIPSFAEANALPTTGFITANAPPSFQALHGNDGYGVAYSLGLTTEGTPNLRPEKSQNITAGVVLQPTSNLSFSADFYRIRKTDVIAPADYSPAVAAYYAGQPIPAGFTVVPGLPDLAQNGIYKNLQPTIGFIIYGFANLNALVTSGFDFSATAKYRLPWNITWTSAAQATYVNRYDLTLPDGTIEHFAGTIGPYQTTSASGTPRFRGNWQNTLDFGRETLTVTAYYTSGYSEAAADNGAFPNNCLSSTRTGTPATYVDGVTPISCKVSPFVDVELHATYDVTKHVQLFVDVDNLLDSDAPNDPTTYGGYQYNPAWANSGIVGRYFKIGAKATF